MRVWARATPLPAGIRPKTWGPFKFETKPLDGVRKPKTWGIDSTKIMMMTRSFCVPW